MFKLAAAALICGLIVTLIRGRRGGPPWLQLAVASFGFFGVITAIAWILSPTSTARTVSDDMSGGLLMLEIVQGRGAVVLPLGFAAIFAAWTLPERRTVVMLGPLAYNLLMSIEATRAQFTSLATPERWIYVTLHTLWTISFLAYIRPVALRALRLPLSSVLAAVPVTIGFTLLLAPSLFLKSSNSPILLHSAHAFGASLIGLGTVAYAYWASLSGALSKTVCLASSLLLAGIAFASGHIPAACVALGWGTLHLIRPRSPAIAKPV
jgi:hypothetical protein